MSGVCAVIGVGPGIGLAVARRFAREGFAAGLVARQPDALGDWVSGLERLGVRVIGLAADAGDAASLTGALDRIEAELGAPDVLVYNPSSSHAGPPTALALDDLLADFRVSVGGALVAARRVAPAMRARGGGTILLTGGGLALHPSAAVASLSIGKAGLRSLAFSLAEELAPAGIHVATVTVAGFVKPGTHFDPDRIADAYWMLHRQAIGAWETELVYR